MYMYIIALLPFSPLRTKHIKPVFPFGHISHLPLAVTNTENKTQNTDIADIQNFPEKTGYPLFPPKKTRFSPTTIRWISTVRILNFVLGR